MIAIVKFESLSRRWALSSVICFACFFLAPTLANSEISPEAGAFFVKQYLPQTYGADAQNWAAVQDTRGVMFFGNTEGLLEYDGTRWRHISLPSAGAVVRSLAVDDDGTVYVGGQNDFGFLRPDNFGVMQYVSLLDQVPAAARNFGDIWTISCTDAGVVFGSYHRIFRWSRTTGMKIWDPATRFGPVFTVDGIPYVVVKGSGLYRISAGHMETVPGGGLREASGDKLEPVPGGELFTAEDMNGAFSFAGSLMVATGRALFRQQEDHFVKYANDAEEFLNKNRIYSCTPLKDGDLAIGTIQGGLVLLTPAGHIDRIVDKRSGLPSNYVDAVYVDRAGSLWLALQRGIAHIENQIPLTRFGDREGIDEIVGSIARQGNTLYAGTTNGLSRLVSSRGVIAHFEPVAGIDGQVLALLPAADTLLVGGQYGVFGVDSSGIQRILDQGLIFSLSRSTRNPSLIYAAGRRGLFLLESHGDGWRKTAQVSSEGRDFLSAIEDSDGKIWATTSAAIWHIDLASGRPKIQQYTEAQGVPPGWKYAYNIEGSAEFATRKGLLRFDSEAGRFAPDAHFGKMFADGSHTVFQIAETPAGDIWIGGDAYQGILHKTSQGYRRELNPLARAEIKELYALHIDRDNVVWAAGANGGLVRYASSNSAPRGTPFQALVNGVRLLRDGNLLGLAGLPKVSHQQDSLGFEFSAPQFEDESRTEYQVRLDGLDHTWSEWSKETRKEYTNLWEGNYTFHVRARDLNGRMSEAANFAFRVLPPWYRTWFAYVTYILLLTGVMALIIKWRLHALEASNRKLEAIIESRTEEIRQQRDEIKLEEERTEALLLNILPGSVADELRTTGVVQPMAFDEITVCFTDFVGFTLSSEKVSAAELVAGLHRYFTAFDEIVGRYGLEKLKTIGDSYMFVGGLPDRKPSHAVDVLMAAFEMVEAVNALSTSRPNWQVRIGVHSGPVVAGVVGVKKFAFDIWGQTVNFASRFESSGAPNRINMSCRTRELVCDFIDCEPRGHVRIKEGRQLEMYFARQIRSELIDHNANGIPPRFAELYYRRFGHPPTAFPSGKSRAADLSLLSLAAAKP